MAVNLKLPSELHNVNSIRFTTLVYLVHHNGISDLVRHNGTSNLVHHCAHSGVLATSLVDRGVVKEVKETYMDLDKVVDIKNDMSHLY